MDKANVRVERDIFKVGSETWVIARDDAQIGYVDLVSEARHFNGVVFLSLAQSILDEGGTPMANICARLRMNLATAQAIHGILGAMISDSMKPVDKSKAN